MRVLVAAASKHGSTAEIAEAIAGHLVAAGHDVVVRDPEVVRDLEGVDAVVLGSAVYAGRWLAAAREFCERLGEKLDGRPVWLFSSGPLGDPPKPTSDPVDVAAAVAAMRARGHQIFTGYIDRDKLSLVERAVVRAVHAAPGDFRDWVAIKDWSLLIDAQLRKSGGASERRE